jgi:SAM-dependent methyltransferase
VSSFIYQHRLAYQLLMRLLYGRYFSARYETIAAEVPAGSHVVDVCAGDGYLYLNYLRAKSVHYQALDISPRLVQWMQQHGIRAQQFDVWKEALPAADIVIMQASLYQFLPDAAPVVEKMLRAARQRVIITEPIRNIASSDNPVLRLVGKRLTRPEAGQGAYQAHRFDQVSLLALAQQFPTLERSAQLPGGREMLIVLRGQADSIE